MQCGTRTSAHRAGVSGGCHKWAPLRGPLVPPSILKASWWGWNCSSLEGWVGGEDEEALEEGNGSAEAHGEQGSSLVQKGHLGGEEGNPPGEGA